jgi:hypothetical protein
MPFSLNKSRQKKRPFVRQFLYNSGYNRIIFSLCLCGSISVFSDGGMSILTIYQTAGNTGTGTKNGGKSAGNGGKIKSPAAVKHEKRRESGNTRRRRNAPDC